MPLIKVKDLYKIFGHHPERAFPLLEQGMTKEEILKKTGNTVAVNGVSFGIEKQEIFVVMGLSGSGKSTVIRCLNRLIDSTRGEILINGQDVMKADRKKLLEMRRTQMSMVFQHFGLFPHRTVVSNVEYGLEIAGMDKQVRNEKAMKALKQVGLEGYAASFPDQLSGGMQQRVGLARALANDPEILLMDEAFSALDPLIRNQMQDELLDLQAELHKTIVFITHDLDEALKLGDRIAILGKDGKIKQIGTAEEILTEPADDYVRSFVQNVDKTKVITASAIMRKPITITIPKEGPSVAVRRMEQKETSVCFVVDQERVLKGVVHLDDVVKLQKQKNVESAIRDQEVYTTTPDTPISDLLTTAFVTQLPIAVLDDKGVLKGVVDRSSVIAEVGADSSDPVTLVEAAESTGGSSDEPNDSERKEV